MGAILYLADHIGASKSIPFTRKVFNVYSKYKGDLSLYFHSMRKTSNEPDPHPNLFTSNTAKKLTPKALLELRNSIDRWGIDTVHAMSARAIIAAVVTKQLFKPDLRIIARLAGRIYKEERWFKIMIRRLSPSIDRFIAPSKSSQEKFIEIGLTPNKIEKQYNFIDLSKFDPTDFNLEEERKRLEIQGSPVIGYVGRLIELKNVDAILRGFKHLLDDNPGASLLLVGEGEKRRSLEKSSQQLGISDSVRFLGFREDIPAIITACDAGILVSEYESFGMPIIEFLAMGRPILATDVGVAQEVQGVNCINDASNEAIYNGLKKTIKDGFSEPDRDSLNPFTSEAYFERVQHLYHELHS